MNKLFGLLLLALVAVAPDVASAAARFAVCSTTCTWDNSSTAMWSTSSGGATGASAPTSADTVTFDAATCVGGTTCTITTFAGTISVQSITWGACTASTTGCIIDASVNNTNFTVAGGSATIFSGSGTGTRKWTAGIGTYDLTSTNANGCFNHQTTTNDTGTTYSGATFICSGSTTAARTWNGGGFTFGSVTINSNASGGSTTFGQSSTYTALSIGAPATIINAGTQTIGALTVSGSSAASPILIQSNSVDTPTSLSFTGSSTVSWIGLRAITTTGAGTFTGNNCINFGRVTLDSGDACNAPSGGGGGGGRIIGG